MILLNIGTVVTLLVVMWAFGFITGIVYKRRLKRKTEAKK